VGAIVADLITTGDTTVVPGWGRYRLDRFLAPTAGAAAGIA
jgi:hypothetical protein